MQRPIFRSPALAQILPRTYEDIPRSFAWFEQMRNQHPVFQNEQSKVWQVFRYEDVSTVITDYTHFSSHAMRGDGNSLLADTLIAKDPPDHRKLRNLVNLAFTPRAVARLSGRIADITQELLDQARARGKVDIVADFAFPLPAKVIAEMLGVPDEDWDIFRRWARVDSASPELTQREREDFVRNMRGEMTDYFSRLLAERRRVPREDLITALSRAEIDGEQLSEHELVSFCFLLLAAGQETTKNLIANFTLCLTDHPGMQEQLVQEPSLIPSAIEEVLRYLPPVWFLIRQTTTDVELQGTRIPANQLVLTWLASANRDATQFPHPEQFDIKREPNHHLAFGHGIHFCVGAPLARLEARVALPMMLEQLRDIQRVESAPIAIRSGIVFVIQSLPITFQSLTASRH
jgi:cytochrome P450